MSPTRPDLPRLHAWFTAVADDDTTLLEALIAHGVPIDIPHPLRHSTALMEATRLGRIATVQWLLERGAAPALLCGMPSGTALHCALRRQHWQIAELLATTMEHCAVLDGYDATPLHSLCAEMALPEQARPMLDIATRIIAKQCPLDALDRDGTAALHHCIINNHYELTALLLDAGANPNALIPDSQVSPLTIAALEKNLSLAELLLKYNADPHSRTQEGSSPVTIYPAMAELVANLG